MIVINLRLTTFFAESIIVLNDTPRGLEISSGGPVTARKANGPLMK